MRFYRLLLRLYPSSFRADYEEELTEVFAERARGAGSVRRTAAAVADVVPNAIATHWELLVQDLRFAFRSLRRSPAFAVTAVLVAALGIGANTIAFSLADFVLVRPLPFAQPDRLIKLWQSTPGDGRTELSPANFRDWKTQSRSFAAMGAYTTRPMNLVGTGEPRRLETIRATPEVLPILGVPALLGRHFHTDDARNGNPVLISYPLWHSQFGGRTDILGTVVRLDGTPHTIVGVMPATFRFPNRDIEAWTPLVLREEDMEDRNDNYLEGIARLRAGVTLEEARQEMKVITARLERQYPRELRETGAHVLRLRDELSSRSRLLVLALCGAAICILLLSCANLASLFLARGAHRARELAVRSALGAGRERLVRQLVTESFVIAAAGGVVGVLIAAASVPLFTRLVPSSLPMSELPGVDLRVLAMAAAFVVVTGLAFGVAPALRAGRSNAVDALRTGARSGGGRTQRTRASLVIIEIVASVVLLISSGLLMRAVWNLQATAPGFRTDDVLTLRTALPLTKYDTVAKRERFFNEVLREVRALPGVRNAGYVTGLPMQMRGGIFPATFQGDDPVADDDNAVSMRMVTPGYFATVRIPLLRGRDVSDADGQKQPFVAVVSESFVRQHFPSGDAIGRRFKVATAERTIVGIVGDVRVRGLERPSEPQVYIPYRQVDDGGLIGYVPKELVVHAGAPESLIPAIRRIVQKADPEQPVSNVRTLSAIVGEETASRVTQLRLLGTLTLIALLIAGIGIHGLLTYNVSRRLPELGVRRALGAPVAGIVKLVVREGVVLAAIGIVIGVLVAYMAARGMGALLVGIRPGDPLTFATATLLCFATVLAGCLGPAVRVANVDPMTALRVE